MDIDQEETTALPYDDEAAARYVEAKREEKPAEEPAGLGTSLQSRIGAGRLYLLSESSAAMNGRLRSNIAFPAHQQPRESTADDVQDEDEDNEYDDEGEDLPVNVPPGARHNAITFSGEPIATLPTQRIFAYASNSNAKLAPLGLEWINDTSFVLVWKTAGRARRAFLAMREAGTLDLEEDSEGYVPAKPVPETLWPMDMRLEKAMGRPVVAQAIIRMRWARPEDVKSREARTKSKFYEKYGENAGKEGQNTYPRGEKRKRGEEDEEERRRLDEDLDRMGEKERRSASPPSRRRRRSASPRSNRRDGRRREPHHRDGNLPVPASGREWDIGKEWDTDEFGRSQHGTGEDDNGRNAGSRRRRDQHGTRRRRDRDREGHRSEPRPARTKDDLDAELDAFLGRS